MFFYPYSGEQSGVAFSKVASHPMKPCLTQLSSSILSSALNAAGVDARGSVPRIDATDVNSALPSFFSKAEPVFVARSSPRLSKIPQHSL